MSNWSTADNVYGRILISLRTQQDKYHFSKKTCTIISILCTKQKYLEELISVELKTSSKLMQP